MNAKTRNIAYMGLLTAAALVLGYFETLLPLPTAVPGIKLGLSNTVLLYALYLMDAKRAWLLMAAKVLLSGFLFAGLSGLIYSLAGGVCSLLVMMCLKRARGFSVVGVSVAGAAAHNLGQCAAACLAVTPRAVLSYLPLLLAAALITGMLTGITAKYVIKSMAARPQEGSNK